MTRRTIASLLVVLLSVGAIIAPASAQQSPSSSLQALAASFFAELSTIRGLRTPGAPPPVVIRSKSEIRRYAEQELNRKYPAPRVEAERKAMVAWGVIATDFDLRRFLLDLLQEQAAAYYDPLGKVVVLADWLTPEERQLALLHELVHALQDRDISLDQFLAPVPGKGDQLLARQAVIEGEAVALSLDLLLQRQGFNLTRIPILPLVQQLAGSLSSGPVFAQAPKFLQHLLLFPYLQGATFIQEFRLQQPWTAMSQLYRDPPGSTAQILHPEKFLSDRQDPLPIALPDLRQILAPGLRMVSEDELGEWGLGMVLETFLDQAAVGQLPNGWRGDRYQVWEDDRGRLALIYRVRWEDDAPAEAFAQAYAGVLEKKHPSLAGKAVRGPGSLWSWQDGPQGFLVERRGHEVLVLERVPGASTNSLGQALWGGARVPGN